jgi:hypothetical protein
MLKTISQALENFCIHQIRIPHTITDGISKKKSFITYIDIETLSGDKYRVYLTSQKNFMQRVSKIFLEEDESDEETLKDIALETTNLIIGSAKVIAEELDINPYTIQTPHFISIDTFNFDYDQATIVNIENDEVMVAIKELN